MPDRFMLALSVANLFVLSCAFLLYYSAWRLFRRRFFLFASIGWATNGLYILLENLPPTRNLVESGLITGVTVISTLFFLLAYYYRYGNPNGLQWREASRWTVLLIISSAIAFSGLIRDDRLSFLVLVTPPIILAFSVFWRLSLFFASCNSHSLLVLLRGHTATTASVSTDASDHRQADPDLPPQQIVLSALEDDRVSGLPPRVTRRLHDARLCFVWSFGPYALLQFCYLLAFDFSTEPWFLAFFVAALILKTINLAAVPLMLLGDFVYVSEILRRTSAAEELGAVTASIDHDIRIPLSNAKKSLELLKLKRQSDSELRTQIRYIELQIERIRAAADVVPALREGQEYYNNRFITWNLVDVVRSAVKAISYADFSPSVRIVLKKTRSKILVEVYRERLITAFVNIVNNAIEASIDRDAERPPPVTVTCLTQNGRAFVDIEDCGTGIPSYLVPKITRPLFSTKDQAVKPNRGIGLFIAARIIQQHHGTLQFESDGESYTKVRVSLPVSSNIDRET